MRVVILTAGSKGDVQPYMALGCGFQSAGHDVCLATNTTFEAEIRSLGLDFHPVEGDPRKILEGEEGLAWLESGKNPLAFMQRFSRIMIPLIKQGLQDSWNACQGSDVMVFSVLGWFVAQSIYDKSGIPFTPAYLQPADPTRAFPSPLLPLWKSLGAPFNRLTYTLIDHSLWKAFRKAINGARRDILDLPPMPLWQPFSKMRRERHPVIYGYSPSFLPKPVDWGDWLHITGYWFLDSQKEWEPSADLADFLQSGPPPVYVGFGSMNNRNPQETTEIVLNALKLSKQRGILLTGWGGLSSADLPDEVFKLKSIPHRWLFPRVAAVVHHCGAGTTASGLRAGVPAVPIPFFADQPFWANRLHRSGLAAKPILRKRLTAQRLAGAINTAVNDADMQRRAVAMKKRISAENGIAAAVEIFHQRFGKE